MTTTIQAFSAAAIFAFAIAGTAGSAQAGMSGLEKLDVSNNAHPSAIVHQTKGKRAGNIVKGLAAGVAIGVIGAAAASGGLGRINESPHERRCRRWLNRCEMGYENACWKFEDHC